MKYPKIRAKTNRLSTDRLFSSNQAVVKSTPASAPRVKPRTTANTRDSPTHRAFHQAASF